LHFSPDGQISGKPVQCVCEKYSAFPVGQIKSITPAILSHLRGVSIVMNAGRDAMDADVLLDEQRVTRTAKSCGPDASTLAFKLAGSIPSMTVTTKPDHRGDHVISRNTIARGMPDCSGEPVVTMLVCFFILHARLRVRRAPGIPCAL
jgi:hypothetical protein